eukprot:349159-Pleurochrysis_carterae.AAC.1
MTNGVAAGYSLVGFRTPRHDEAKAWFGEVATTSASTLSSGLHAVAEWRHASSPGQSQTTATPIVLPRSFGDLDDTPRIHQAQIQVSNTTSDQKNTTNAAAITTTAAAATASSTSTGSTAVPVSHSPFVSFVDLPAQASACASLVQDALISQSSLLIGPKGSGKTSVARRFAETLGYKYPLVVYCYRDMSARDLLQRREVDGRGSTVWRNAEAVTAATEGGLLILEG